MSRVVDLRSDTVTRPGEAMRRRMAEAEVGDDVYGEDPTVNRLEEAVAERLGKEAALFVPSGTMANQLAILLHTQRGDEVFIHRDSHTHYYETGGAALWAGVTVNALDGKDGLVTPSALAAAIRPANIHFPRPRLLVLENTHNRAGGIAFAPDQINPVAAAAHEQGLLVHIDGARLFNAAVALGTPAAALVESADTVSICLSKGLGAPVGSLLCGSAEHIATARRYRKALGGGMRQAGILAAAGLYALENHVDRLAEDHRRAARLAAGLRELGYRVQSPARPTNMVMVDVDGSAEALAAFLSTHGVLAGPMDSTRLRLVTHLDVDDAGIELTLRVFALWGAQTQHVG